MLKNSNLAKSISDVSWSKFVKYLEYKAEWYGRKLKVDTFFASSQLCNICGYKNEKVKDLKLENGNVLSVEKFTIKILMQV